MSSIPPSSNNDGGQQAELYVTSIIFTTISLVIVPLRILSRRLTHQNLWWDDYLLVICLLVSITQLTFVLQAIEHGAGRHVDNVPASDYATFRLYEYLSQLCYPINVTFVKCSIVCLYIRIFNIRRLFFKLCCALLLFSLSWLVAVLFSTVFQCSPVEASWDQSIQNATCIHHRTFAIATNAPNILGNVFITVMPMPLIWPLQMSKQRKFGLCATFLVAFGTTIVSILRVVESTAVSARDLTYTYAIITIYSFAEENIGVALACLPIVVAGFRCLFSRKRAYTSEPPLPLPFSNTVEKGNLRAAIHCNHHTHMEHADDSDKENLVSAPEESIHMVASALQMDVTPTENDHNNC